MALPAGRYGVTKNQLLKIKKLPMNTIKLIEDLYEKYSLLGSAAFKNSTSVVTQSTDLVESGAVKDIVGWGNKNLLDPSILTTGGLIYVPVYVGDGDFTLSTDAPLNSENSANVFLLAGNVQTGGSTANDGAWSGQTRTKTAVNGYVTVASNTSGGFYPRTYHNQLEKGSTATAYEPYHASVEESLEQKCDNSVIAPTENGTTVQKSGGYAAGSHAIRNGAFITWKNAKAQGETINDASDYTSGDVADALKGYDFNNIFSNLSNIPFGFGRVGLNASISPIGSDLGVDYIKFGNSEGAFIIAGRPSTGMIYVTSCYNGTWSAWKSFDLSSIS